MRQFAQPTPDDFLACPARRSFPALLGALLTRRLPAAVPPKHPQALPDHLRHDVGLAPLQPADRPLFWRP